MEVVTRSVVEGLLVAVELVVEIVDVEEIVVVVVVVRFVVVLAEIVEIVVVLAEIVVVDLKGSGQQCHRADLVVLGTNSELRTP